MEKQMIVSGLCDVITALLPAPDARLLKILRGNSRQITVKLSWNNRSEGKNAGEFPHARTRAHTHLTLFSEHTFPVRVYSRIWDTVRLRTRMKLMF